SAMSTGFMRSRAYSNPSKPPEFLAASRQPEVREQRDPEHDQNDGDGHENPTFLLRSHAGLGLSELGRRACDLDRFRGGRLRRRFHQMHASVGLGASHHGQEQDASHGLVTVAWKAALLRNANRNTAARRDLLRAATR